MIPSFLPTATHKIAGILKAIVGLILIAVFAVIAFFIPEPIQPVREFDHSVCQYPSRITNPPNGCDNSDRANVDTADDIKGVVVPPSPENATSHNIETVDKSVEPVEYDAILRDNYGNPIKGK